MTAPNPINISHSVERDDETEFRAVISSPARTLSRRYGITVVKRRRVPAGQPIPAAEISFPGLSTQPAEVVAQFGASLTFAAALAREQDSGIQVGNPLHAAVWEFGSLAADVSARLAPMEYTSFRVVHEALDKAAAKRLEQVRSAIETKIGDLQVEAQSQDVDASRASSYAIVVLENLLRQLT